MDDRTLRKLSAAAEHERFVAGQATAAVEAAQAKLEKVEAQQRDAVDIARRELAEAEAAAEDAAARADEAEDAYRAVADGVSVTAAAQSAAASGKAT